MPSSLKTSHTKTLWKLKLTDSTFYTNVICFLGGYIIKILRSDVANLNVTCPASQKVIIVINIITVIIITIIIVIQTVQLFTMLFFLNQGWLTSTTSPTSTIALLRDFQAWRHCKLLFWFFISVIPLDWLTHSLINKLPLGFYLSIYYVIQSYYVYNPFLNRFCV